jgi:hypothetical protein
MKYALLLAGLAAAACGKQTFLAAAFVQTPALQNPADPSHPFPEYQIVTAYFGTIDTTDPTSIDASKIAGVADAAVDISFHHVGTDAGNDPSEDRDLYPPGTPAASNKWQQTDAGIYTLSSNDEPKLTFEVGQPYRMVLIDQNGDAFGAEFVPGPNDDMKEFQSTTCPSILGQAVSRCIPTYAHGTDLTINRCEGLAPNCAPLTSGPQPGFVVVGKVDPNNPSANPTVTYTTVPQDAATLLKYELSDQPYRLSSQVIPGSQAFPSAGLYAVVLVTAKPGKVSGNSFPGSTAVVGSGAAGLIQVQ